MAGMNAETGKLIDGLADLRQSLHTILATPKGSRVMRRDFGSDLIDLVDSPITPSNELRIYTAIADPIDRFEPRLQLRNVQVGRTKVSAISVTVTGIYEREEVTVSDLTVGN